MRRGEGGQKGRRVRKEGRGGEGRGGEGKRGGQEREGGSDHEQGGTEEERKANGSNEALDRTLKEGEKQEGK